MPDLIGHLFRRPSFPAPTGNLLTAVLAVLLLVSCGGKEPVDPTPPTPPAKDIKAPTITVSTNTVNVIAGPEATLSGSELKIGATSIATWKDDVSTSCTVALNLTPTTGTTKAVNS